MLIEKGGKKEEEWQRLRKTFGEEERGGQVFVRNLTGSTIEINIEPHETVIDLKRKVEAKKGIPVSSSYLIFSGKVLENSATLKSKRIIDSCNVHLACTCYQKVCLVTEGDERVLVRMMRRLEERTMKDLKKTISEILFGENEQVESEQLRIYYFEREEEPMELKMEEGKRMGEMNLDGYQLSFLVKLFPKWTIESHKMMEREDRERIECFVLSLKTSSKGLKLPKPLLSLIINTALFSA